MKFRIIDIVFTTVLVALVIHAARDSAERRAIDAAHQDRLDKHFDYIQGDYSNMKHDRDLIWKHIRILYRGPSTLFRQPTPKDRWDADWESQYLEDKGGRSD